MKLINSEDLEKKLKKYLYVPAVSPEQVIFNRGVQTCINELIKAESIDIKKEPNETI